MIVWSGVDTSFDPGPLWVRTLSGDDARVLAGTERAMYAFWSPDSRSIGFFADRKLKRIDLAGGAPITLCDIPDIGRGGTWNRGGVIVFSGARAGPLFRVPATGGVPEPVTKLDTSRGDTTHRWPHFLPDGRRFLYLASPNVSEKRAVFVATLDGGENRPLALAPDASLSASESGHPTRTEAVANAAYASGHLLFVQRGTLYARPFDPSSATITGPAVVVAENVASGFGIIRSMFSASQSGDLVFVTEPTNFDVRVEWIDRGGHRSPALKEALVYSDPQLSPNGRRLAIVIQDAQSRQADIWTIDLAGGARTRLTFGPGSSRLPIWSPDGNSIAYVAGRQKVFGLFEKSSTGTGAEKLLLDMKGDTLGRPTWSPDGQLLLYTIWDPSEGTKHDIWGVPVSPPAKPFPYLRTTADEDEARFSPNGKYVAHTASTESGSNEVYVQTFPAGGGKWQISTHGGATPRWRRDGKELFYLGSDGRIFSAQVRAGPAFEVGTPRPVIESLAQVSDYDVAPDGQRLLICKPVVDPAHLPLRLIAHWPAALER
jgi:Tol biopolymer transport system component